jgi:CcmD family protein
VGIAYGFIWVALLAYVLFIARGLGRVRGEMDDLRRKIATALDAASSKR